MFDIDTGKLLIVAVLALIVIGPKDLPRVLRQLGQSVGKLRRMSAEFQGQFMDAIKDAEIEDIRRELKDLEKTADFDPARDLHAQMTGITGEVKNAIAAVEAAPDVPSPAKGFVLPEIPEALRDDAERDEAAMTTLAEGVAPAVPEPDAAGEAMTTGPQASDGRKRKLFVKPHRSRFARMNSERTAELTGQAIAMRQRLVRARKPMPHDALSS